MSCSLCISYQYSRDWLILLQQAVIDLPVVPTGFNINSLVDGVEDYIRDVILEVGDAIRFSQAYSFNQAQLVDLGWLLPHTGRKDLPAGDHEANFVFILSAFLNLRCIPGLANKSQSRIILELTGRWDGETQQSPTRQFKRNFWFLELAVVPYQRYSTDSSLTQGQLRRATKKLFHFRDAFYREIDLIA